MTRVQFGLVVPGDMLEKSRRHRYMQDVNCLLNTVKGSHNSAWFIDHLQSEDSDVLEGSRLSLQAALPIVPQPGAGRQDGRFILGIGADWHEPELKQLPKESENRTANLCSESTRGKRWKEVLFRTVSWGSRLPINWGNYRGWLST